MKTMQSPKNFNITVINNPHYLDKHINAKANLTKKNTKTKFTRHKTTIFLLHLQKFKVKPRITDSKKINTHILHSTHDIRLQMFTHVIVNSINGQQTQ